MTTTANIPAATSGKSESDDCRDSNSPEVRRCCHTSTKAAPAKLTERNANILPAALVTLFLRTAGIIQNYSAVTNDEANPSTAGIT